MLQKWFISVILCLFTLTCVPLVWAAPPGIHYFDCKECHLAGLTINALGGGNVCLKCHDLLASDITLSPGAPPPLDGHTDGRFSVGDASNAFGHGSGQPGAYQTSHTWAAPSDTLAAAGAQAPLRAEYPQFYSRYGTSTGKITCSRCHNPHGAAATNPKLLVMGAGSADAMCRACHRSWLLNDHGWLTHPIVADYSASVAANPDKYRATLSNQANADIQLVNGGVSCTSCHGVHFVDSDSTTIDGPGQALSQAEGRLLRGDGPERADQSALCQTCHSYAEHGNNSGEKAGCLVCHSGHSYDPSAPNYYVLRKTVNTATFGMKSGLEYSSPDVLNSTLIHTFWNDRVDGEAQGYCEKCHGDAAALPGSFHSSAAVCTDCHVHNPGASGSFGHGGGGDCTVCHAADHMVDNAQMDWVTIFDNTAGHSYELGSPPFTVDAYASCSMCHQTNLLSVHSSNCNLCHFGSSPPRDSFTDWNQTCQQGSCHPSYHGDASYMHDTEWDNDNCNNCHAPSFDIPWTYDPNLPGYVATYSACGKCHTLEPDATPPVSNSDTRPDYADAALINIWAHDASAIQAIYYRLDGGATQTYGSPVEVAPPANGSQAHTLEFWARDTANNVETPNVSSFTVTRDTEPPVTTADAKTLYGADATIRFTATDNATAFPVSVTYFKDGASGTVQTGTTAIIPEPANGSEEHTLYFWSVDHAGNVEDPPKSATFTIVANGLEHTDLFLGDTVYFYTDPNASGPRVSYKIYIDDVLKKTITKTTEGASTTTWNCPETAVSSGSHIDVVVDAWFTSYTGTPDTNAPRTYTLTLPDGVAYLGAAPWSIAMNMSWEPVEYEPGYGDFAYVEALPAIIDNIVYVTTAPDATPPVTTSNITSGSVYVGNKTFTLTPNDPGGSGVASTRWQLDSTSGSWTSGTSVTVAAPASGTKAHTVYWYSTDNAGNQEAVKSVSFSSEAPGTAVASLVRSAAARASADLGLNNTAWANYTIRLDGAPIGVIKQANSTTTWPCPTTNIVGAGQIEIIVKAGFTDRPVWGPPDSNVPITYTLTLPAGAKRLEAVNWNGFSNKSVGTDYHETYDEEYTYVTVPAGTFGNIVYATTGSDATSPVTTIDAVNGNTYVGDQTFTLSPTDAGGSGVESTWWQLDGSGVWTIGVSVPVTSPASGTASHTITWYSRDHATNQEAQRSITFNLQAP